MMKLTIAEVDHVLWKGDADAVTVPGAAGIMTVLPNHMPLVTTLVRGTILVRSGEEEREFPVSKGILEVGKTETTILL